MAGYYLLIFFSFFDPFDFQNSDDDISLSTIFVCNWLGPNSTITFIPRSRLSNVQILFASPTGILIFSYVHALFFRFMNSAPFLF